MVVSLPQRGAAANLAAPDHVTLPRRLPDGPHSSRLGCCGGSWSAFRSPARCFCTNRLGLRSSISESANSTTQLAAMAGYWPGSPPAPAVQHRDRGDVVLDGRVREQPGLLDHVAAATPPGGPAPRRARPAGSCPLSARPAGRPCAGWSFCAAVRPGENHDLPVGNLQAEIIDRDGAARVVLAGVADRDRLPGGPGGGVDAGDALAGTANMPNGYRARRSALR